jgi:hypothetical protein
MDYVFDLFEFAVDALLVLVELAEDVLNPLSLI